MFVSDDVLRMVATARTLSLLLPLLAGGVASFSIVSVSEHAAPYTAGDTVQLGCRADGWWEYCSWTHGDTQCDLEWKYATVSIQALLPNTEWYCHCYWHAKSSRKTCLVINKSKSCQGHLNQQLSFINYNTDILQYS